MKWELASLDVNINKLALMKSTQRMKSMLPPFLRPAHAKSNKSHIRHRGFLQIILIFFIARKHVKQDSNVNEEWKSMFGSLEPPSIQQALPKGSDQEVMPAGKPPRSESSAGICVPLSASPQVLSPQQ